MKLLLLSLIMIFQSATSARAVETLTSFELSDQNEVVRSYQFPRAKVTVMTLADQKGSEQLAPWIQPIYDKYQKRIDIDGIADVSIIPGPFHGMFRDAFKKKMARSVMLDWKGDVVKQFGATKGVANIYVIDRQGRIVKHLTGDVSASALSELTLEIDKAMASSTDKRKSK